METQEMQLSASTKRRGLKQVKKLRSYFLISFPVFLFKIIPLIKLRKYEEKRRPKIVQISWIIQILPFDVQ